MIINERTRVSSHDVAIFTRQFLAMLDAGVPLHRALDMYARGDDEKLGRVIDEVANKVVAGSTLSNALSHFPRVFSPVYIGITRAGESSGRLNVMLGQLAVLLERQDNLRRKIVSSLTYPAFLLAACVLCSATFMFYILPAMGPLYNTLGVPLPWPTRFLVGLGELLKNWHTWAAVAALALFTAIYLWPAWRRRLARDLVLRARVHQQLLEIPLLGHVLRKMIHARLLFTLATLLEVGIPAATSLVMVREVAGNQAVQNGLRLSCQRLEEGCTLAECLNNILPAGAVAMLTVGEESSDLTRAANFVARVYEEDAEMAVDYFVALSEPLIMAGMGAVATFLILALILPIISLLQRM